MRMKRAFKPVHLPLGKTNINMERLLLDLTKYEENIALIHHQSDKTSKTIKYKELLNQVLIIKDLIAGENILQECQTIGIYSTNRANGIVLLLAILEAGFAFCFLNQNEKPENLNELGIKYFFSDQLINGRHLEKKATSEVWGQKTYFYKCNNSCNIRNYKDNGDALSRICYTVTTSGSTGKRKIVRVTAKALRPNIVDLQRIFKLDKDIIFSSAPVTFDVFVLDVCLALHTGSALMIIDDSLRFSHESIEYMFPESGQNGVTFMQMTPSLFHQFGLENIQQKIFKSGLKYLLFGGENFPSTKEVLRWQNWDDPSRKRIFNIYGTTEISCWASIHEVTKNDLEAGEIPLGELLEGTLFAFIPHDELHEIEHLIIMTKNRFCIADDQDDKLLSCGLPIAHKTGDLVKRRNGKIFYYGRSNDIIKRFGSRVDLSRIEHIAHQVHPAVACIYTKKKIVLFYQSEAEQQLIKYHLQQNLNSSEIPDEYRRINSMPLSDHGKVSKEKLKEIYKEIIKCDEETRLEAEDSFLEAINQIFNLKLAKGRDDTDEPDGKRIKTELDLTFKSLGGTSFDALRLSMKIEESLGISNELLPMLLDDTASIREICSYLKDLKPKDAIKIQEIILQQTKICSTVVAQFDLKKCVDASPALIELDNKNSFVCVGSHSHELITINSSSLKIISKTLLDDRIESEVVRFNDSGIVGCYNGQLYCFDFQSGAIKWKFASNGMIKSKALIIDDLIIFGNYNYQENLWCLQVNPTNDVTLKWNRLVGSRGVLAAPLLIDNSSAFICTLDGICEMIDVKTGNKKWNRQLESAIFSNPQRIPGTSKILVAEVSKKIHCLTTIDGNDLWSIKTEGHIFSSFHFHQQDDELLILFGCHDKNLRCYSYREHSEPSPKWSVELQSQIYGTPKVVNVNSESFAISFSTSGFLNFFKLSNGQLEHSHRLPGEVFSTPTVKDQTIFIGCRDNFLYCIQF